MREHARLAGAGAGQHEQRAGAVRRRPRAAAGSAPRGAAPRAAAVSRRPQRCAVVVGTRPYPRPGSGPGPGAAGGPRPAPCARCRSGPRPARSSSPIRSASPRRASATGSGRCSQSVSGPSGLRPSTRTGWPGLPTTVVFGGTSWITTEFAPTLAPWPTVIGPSSLAPDADRDVVLDGRVALAGGEAGAAQRDALEQGHAVADLRRLAHHDAGAVVHEEVAPDPGRGMDLDAGHDAARIRQQTRHERHVGIVQRVGDPVSEDRVYAWIGEQDLRGADRPGGRVAIAGGRDVLAQLADDAREGATAPSCRSALRRPGRRGQQLRALASAALRPSSAAVPSAVTSATPCAAHALLERQAGARQSSATS